jgi:hypothetical protein
VYNIIYRTPLEHSDSLESSLYFGVDEIISFQMLVGNLDKMTVAKLSRQRHRSLDSYLKSPTEDPPWALALSKQTTSLASLTAKLVGPCQCIYEALKIVFLGPQSP